MEVPLRFELRFWEPKPQVLAITPQDPHTYAYCIVAKFVKGEAGTKQEIDIMRAKIHRPRPLLGDHTYLSAIVCCHAH